MRPGDEAVIARASCLAGVVVYPAWGLLCQWLLPASQNDLPGRLVVAAVLAAIALAITFRPAVAARAEAWFAAGCVVLVGHYHYLVVLNGTSAFYVAGIFVTLGALDALIQRPRPLMGLSIGAFLTALPVAWSAGDQGPLAAVLLVGVAMQQALFLFALRTRLALEGRLAEADASNRALSASLDSTFDGVYVLAALDGRIRYANQGAAVQSGRPQAGLVGLSSGDVLPTLDVPRLAAELRAGGAPVRLLEAVCRRVDGAENDVEVLVQRDPHGDALIAVVRDATARKRLERELTAQNQRLTELDRLKGELIGAVSHELRTPLHAIRAYTELLGEELADGIGPDQALYLRRITESAGRLQGQIDDLLDVARLEGGALRMAFQPMDPHEVVVAAMGTFAPQARAKGLRLEAEVPQALPVVVADEARVNQVVLNLVGNALKFTPAGGRVVLRATATADRVRLEVRDSGPGIPEAEQALIFEKFYQSSGADTRHHGGAGLGLAIARGIVDAHRGAIGVSSVPGQGATFWVELPVGGPG